MPQPWQASRRPEQDARFLANARSLTNSAAGRALDSVGGDVGAALEELVIGQRHPHHVEIALHGREAALNLAAQHTDPAEVHRSPFTGEEPQHDMHGRTLAQAQADGRVDVQSADRIALDLQNLQQKYKIPPAYALLWQWKRRITNGVMPYKADTSPTELIQWHIYWWTTHQYKKGTQEHEQGLNQDMTTAICSAVNRSTFGSASIMLQRLLHHLALNRPLPKTIQPSYIEILRKLGQDPPAAALQVSTSVHTSANTNLRKMESELREMPTTNAPQLKRKGRRLEFVLSAFLTNLKCYHLPTTTREDVETQLNRLLRIRAEGESGTVWHRDYVPPLEYR